MPLPQGFVLREKTLRVVVKKLFINFILLAGFSIYNIPTRFSVYHWLNNFRITSCFVAIAILEIAIAIMNNKYSHYKYVNTINLLFCNNSKKTKPFCNYAQKS